MTENLQILDAVLKCIIAVVAAIWAVWNYLYSKEKESTQILTSLYSKYHSREMIELRGALWLQIEDINKNKPGVSFARLWTELNEEGKIKDFPVTVNIYEFGAFWNSLLAMNRKGLIKKSLAREFFGYQYSYWKYHLANLIKNTNEIDSDRPEILTSFSSGELDWLEFAEPEIKLYSLKKNAA